jgi:quercetin dioxygenase-like cupin family protein
MSAAKEAGPGGTTVMDVSSDRFHHLLLENDKVRVFRVGIPPGEETWVHRHERDYVFLILARAQILDRREGQEPLIRNLEAGEALFLEGGFTHQVQNLGSEPFRAVIIEVK